MNKEQGNAQEKNTQNTQENRKATYEELNNYCIQLYNQNKELTERMKQMNMMNTFKRIDYLFAVLQHSDKFDEAFVSSCASEIKEALIIPEKQEEKPAEKEGE